VSFLLAMASVFATTASCKDDSAADACAAEEEFECVASCGSDALVGAECDGNTWTCPEGHVPIDSCSSCPEDEAFECVMGCGSDALIPAVCEDGAWTCAEGLIPVESCT